MITFLSAALIILDMDLEDLDREINAVKYIRDVRIYRFRKEMHELDEDLKKLKQDLKEKSGELSEAPAETKDKQEFTKFLRSKELSTIPTESALS